LPYLACAAFWLASSLPTPVLNSLCVHKTWVGDGDSNITAALLSCCGSCAFLFCFCTHAVEKSLAPCNHRSTTTWMKCIFYWLAHWPNGVLHSWVQGAHTSQSFQRNGHDTLRTKLQLNPPVVATTGAGMGSGWGCQLVACYFGLQPKIFAIRNINF
jgi:hypothetical protein